MDNWTVIAPNLFIYFMWVQFELVIIQLKPVFLIIDMTSGVSQVMSVWHEGYNYNLYLITIWQQEPKYTRKYSLLMFNDGEYFDYQNAIVKKLFWPICMKNVRTLIFVSLNAPYIWSSSQEFPVYVLGNFFSRNLSNFVSDLIDGAY